MTTQDVEFFRNPIIYNYWIICVLILVLVQILNLNTFKNSIWSINWRYSLLLASTSSIPMYSWYKISYLGYYIPSTIFILELIIGGIIIITISRFNIFKFRRHKILIISFCVLQIIFLTKNIIEDINKFMLLP